MGGELRIVRVGAGCGRSRAYHSSMGCLALRAARVNPLATGPTPGYKYLNQAQADARGLHPCAWCHGAASPGWDGHVEVRALSWGQAERHQLVQVML